jgi:5-methylcytosine-specific restriction endonuclease McrA
MITEKKCTICKQVKPFSEFYKDAQRRDGFYNKCKQCHASLVAAWQQKNIDKFKQIKKEWKKSHPEKHKEQSIASQRRHPERRRAYGMLWREKNPEYGSNWRQNNLEKICNYSQTRRARLLGNGGNLTTEEWRAILDFYGHRCLRCGRADVKLTIDHVLPIFLGGTHTIDNVQPLCGPCNSSKKDKHIDYRKELYHETPRD